MSSNAAKDVGSGLKKIPSQARARERVDRILNASSGLLAEVGYGAMNTNLIAEKAGVPVGSIYQYFDSKDDIVVEVTNRFEERIRTFAEQELGPDLLASGLRPFLTVFAKGLLEIQASDAAFLCVFSGPHSDPRLEASAQRLRDCLVQHLYIVMCETWPNVPQHALRRTLAVWAEVTKSLISLRGEMTSDELAEEIVVILIQYAQWKIGLDGLVGSDGGR